MPAAVASKQEGTFRESGVRRPSYHRNHRGTGREPGVPCRRCKNQEGRKKPTHLLWTVLSRYVGTDLENHSPGHEAILLQRWKAAKRSESSEIQLGLEKRGLWVTLEPGRKSFRAGCPRSSLCVVSSSFFCVYCPKKLSCTKMCKAWASGCPKESSRRSCPHRSLQL